MPLWYLIEAVDTVFHRVTKPVLAPVTYLSKDPYLDIQPSSIFFHYSPESQFPCPLDGGPGILSGAHTSRFQRSSMGREAEKWQPLSTNWRPGEDLTGAFRSALGIYGISTGTPMRVEKRRCHW